MASPGTELLALVVSHAKSEVEGNVDTITFNAFLYTTTIGYFLFTCGPFLR